MKRSHQHRGMETIIALAIGFSACAGATNSSSSGGGDTGSGGDSASAGEAGSQASGGGSGGDDESGGSGGSNQGGGVGSTGGSNGGGQAGGKTGSAGAPAAGGSGGGSGGTIAAVPCTMRAYCNDFEAIAVGQTPPNTGSPFGATMGVTEEKAFSGGRSLKITSQGGASANANFSVSPGNKLTNPKKIAYARMMIWMDQLPNGAADPGHWGVMSMEGAAMMGNTSFNPRLRFGGSKSDDSMWLYFGNVGGGAIDCTFRTKPNQLPLKKWTCAEMMINEDELYNYTISLDSAEIFALSVIADQANYQCFGAPATINWYIPKPTTFKFGWEYVHTQGRAVTVYIDDVVIDQKPIGCPAGAPSKP